MWLIHVSINSLDAITAYSHKQFICDDSIYVSSLDGITSCMYKQFRCDYVLNIYQQFRCDYVICVQATLDVITFEIRSH